MKHRAMSAADRAFSKAVESCEVSASGFNHAAHVRLAYTLLCEDDLETATHRMRTLLRALLDHLGADEAKYHETMTRAWMLAVAHFMSRTEPCSSFSGFIEHNPALLDFELMLTHYSSELLFSEQARTRFLAPDLMPFPEHA